MVVKDAVNKRAVLRTLSRPELLDSLGGNQKTVHEHLYTDRGACEPGEKIFYEQVRCLCLIW